VENKRRSINEKIPSNQHKRKRGDTFSISKWTIDETN
jgi:hypothetical protein